MGKMKVHELAKKLDKTSKEIITIAQELGIEVKTHMSSLEDNMIQKIEDKVKGVKSTDSKNNKVKETKKKRMKVQ